MRIFLSLLALILGSSSVKAQLFVEPSVGLFQQTAKEQQFLAALSTTGQLIDFDDVGLASGDVASNQWASLGVTISSPAGTPPLIRGTDASLSAHSQPHCILRYNFPQPTPEDIHMTFSPPVEAVSFWLIDSELNPGDLDRIQFLDAAGGVLLDIPMPVNGATTVELGIQGNLFIGFISATPIGELRLVERASDFDGVGLDDLRFIPTGAPSRPGTDEGLSLLTSVSAAPPSGVPFDTKTLTSGDAFTLRFLATNAALLPGTPVLVGQLYPAGSSATSPFPGIAVDPFLAPIFSFFDGTTAGGPLGPLTMPVGGLTLTGVVPVGLGGLHLLIQGFSLTTAAANGLFATTHAHELQIL